MPKPLKKMQSRQNSPKTDQRLVFDRWRRRRLTLCVKPRANGCNIVGQQLPTFLLFCDRRSVAQQCWIRLHSSSLLGPRTLIMHGLQRLMGCILPTMHCRSQHCWELLHPFAHHCQQARNNSIVGSCCVRLHAASGVKCKHCRRYKPEVKRGTPENRA